jgi:hypothetical protein
MKLNELLENAVLDAYGLLDEEQRLAFERAFRAAPQSVRDQIRREQERVAGFESSLSQEHPNPELKERVVGAVLAEMEAERANHELTAMALRGDDIAGAVEASGRRYVSGWWQTAAIALLAVSAVLGTMVGLGLSRPENRVAEQLMSMLKSAGAKDPGIQAADILASDKINRLTMEATDAAQSFAGGASAIIWVSSVSEHGLVTIQTNSAPKSELVVRVRDASGRLVYMDQLDMTSQLGLVAFSMSEWSGADIEIAIRDETGAETVLFTRTV